MLGRGLVLAVAIILSCLPNLVQAQQSNLDVEIARLEEESDQLAVKVESRQSGQEDELILDSDWDAPAVRLIAKPKTRRSK